MTSSLHGLKAFLSKYDGVIESRKNNSDLCSEEFQAIKHQSAEDKKELLALEGGKEINKKKNRYKDILPYDHSRVVLPKEAFKDGSDYINANHIEDGSGNRAYIAAQAPMPNTVDDFWRMIWHFKIKVVIMACKEVEMGKIRCHRYWPDEGQECRFNDMKITLVGSKQYAHNMLLRELKADKNGKKHMVTQLHYLDWPDHGAPETTETVLQLIEVLREKHPEDHPPILVHCSAGCGRTGALIATDYARKLIKSHKSEICVFKVVSHLRKLRPALVQSKEQYEFLYEVFREMVAQELRLYESQYDSDYMNFGVFPKNSESLALPVEKQCIIEKNSMVEARRQIVLPAEHVVNTDSCGIRRSRSAYGKKSKKDVPNLIIAPPVPIKENKFSRSMEKLEIEGPVLPPKSPNSPKKHPLLPVANQMQGNSQVPPVKPKLLKKPSLESFFYEKRHFSEGSADIHLHEDFIPAPTPVGYSSYPMWSKMSTPNSDYPSKSMKPAIAPRSFSPSSVEVSNSAKMSFYTKQYCVEENKREKSPSNSLSESHVQLNKHSAPDLINFNECDRGNLNNNSDKQNIINKLFRKAEQGKNEQGVVDKNVIGISARNMFYTGEHEKPEYATIDKTLISNFDNKIPSSNNQGTHEYAVANNTFHSNIEHRYIMGDEGLCEYAVVNKLEKNKGDKGTSHRTKCINSDYAVVDNIGKASTVLKDVPKKSTLLNEHHNRTYEFGNGLNSSVEALGKSSRSFYENGHSKEDGVNSEMYNKSNGKSKLVQSVSNHSPKERSPQGKNISPYMVTEVGIGYKKDLSWSVSLETSSARLDGRPQVRSPDRMLPLKYPDKAEVKSPERVKPPLPSRRSAPLIVNRESKADDCGDYAEIIAERSVGGTVDSTSEATVSPQSGMSWFSNIVRNKGRRTAMSTTTSDGMGKQLFNINDTFGFPKRLPAKPKGPRPPPQSWAKAAAATP